MAIKLIDSLLLHPKTRLKLEQLVKNPPHATIIAAGMGSGKKTVIKSLAAEIIELENFQKLEQYPYFFHVKRLKNKSYISIQQVRTVIEALKLKTPGAKKIRRIIFIEDVHFLSIPAQNAILKVLEEPASDTIFLMSVNSTQNLLPTILSRSQIVDILPIGASEAALFWKDSDYSDQALQSAWKLSGGAVGLLTALLSENTDHPLKQAVDEAKVFLKSSKYERLLMADRLSRNKENFQLFLDALSRTLSFLHHSSINHDKSAQSKNLLSGRRIVNETSRAIKDNSNSKLVALKLVLGLKI
jgi:replication-associated recombination protein RarA